MAEDSWYSGAWDWLGNNADTIGTIGVDAYNAYNATKANNAFNDYLKESEKLNAEQTNTSNQQAHQTAQAQYATQMQNQALFAANMAAQVEAMRRNEVSRLKAAKRANKYSKNMYKKLLTMYEPYRQTADMLLPQMTQTYQNSLGLQNAMGNYVSSPQQVAKLDASVPAYNVNIPLPDSVRLK